LAEMPIQDIIVVGMGRIGLPTAACLADSGYHVVGVDIDDEKVKSIRKGGVDQAEPGLSELLNRVLDSGSLRVVADPEGGDAFVLCLPTLLNEDNTCDLSCLSAAMDSLSGLLEPGNLVVLESTVPVNTTRDFLVPGFRDLGVETDDIDFAYAPERITSGNMLDELRNQDRIIGGITRRAAERAKIVYSSFVDGEIVLTDASTAELVKLAENTYRDINIAFANEIALFCEREGLDAQEAIALANRHPRVNIHRPGPAVGGHCIPVVPYFLAQNTTYDVMIRAARSVNESMPRHIANLVLRAVSGVEHPVVALMGVAYKADSSDPVNSPAIQVMGHLTGEGLEILLYDPLVRHPDIDIASLRKALSADCIVFLVAHSEFRKLDPVKPRRGMGTLIDAADCIDVAAWGEEGWLVEPFGRRKTRA